MKLSLPMAVAGCCLCAGLAQAPSQWTPEFAMTFQTIGAVTPSPDGARVAWTQTRNIMEPEKSEQNSQIFLADSDGKHRIQLTRGDKSATAPAFSPDGQMLYFTSARSGKNNVYRILIEGGEAEQITEFKGDVAEFHVSPDGKTVAFIGAEPAADEEKAKKEKRDFRVIDANPANAGLFAVPAEANEDGKREQKRLFTHTFHLGEFDWSPDGRRIAFSHQPAPGADLSVSKSDVSIVEVASGAVHVVSSLEGVKHSPHFSPDGRYLAFEQSPAPVRWAGERRLMIMPVEGGAPRALPVTYDEEPHLIGWASDSRHLLYDEARHTRHALYSMPVDGPPHLVYEPARGTFAGATLNAGGTHAGIAWETPTEAPEAYVLALAKPQPQRVSAANVDQPRMPLGETQVIQWKAKDGRTIEGLLTMPAHYQNGVKVPLILNIHGGPTGVFTESFIGRGSVYPIATFASRGWAVLRPNPRGSGGYNREFRFANMNDWGGKDYEDIMSGVDHVIAMGVADPDRMAVMGWSYGGYMTSWVITHTHRFKAAAVGAGVTNLWSFTGTSDVTGFLPDYFGGNPWEQFDSFQKHSPITFVKGVTTPTLILHGEADDRVPTSQGYEFYHALKNQGVTTKMVVYPRQPHGPREPKFVLDIAQRQIDWVEKYVR